MSLAISKNEVKNIAKLCDLELTEEEISYYSKILTETLTYIETLDELDLSETSETHNVTGLKNVFQVATSQDQTLSHKDAMANASEEVDGLFATTGVFEDRSA